MTGLEKYFIRRYRVCGGGMIMIKGRYRLAGTRLIVAAGGGVTKTGVDETGATISFYWHGGSSNFYITFTPSEGGGVPSGQPLPGALAALAIGGAALVVRGRRRRAA